MSAVVGAACTALLVMPLAAQAPSSPSSPQAQARGYTLPVLDLAFETHRRVVVDCEPGQYFGHPTTVLLEDGRTILAVYPKGHGRGAIILERSEDGGRTWSDRLPVPDNWATSQETPTIHRVIAPDGRKRLILFSGLHPIRMAASEDDGRTWTPLSPIGDYGGIVAMSSVVSRRTGAGHYFAVFHDDGRFIAGSGKTTPEMTLYQVDSTDGGRTWSAPRVLHAGADVHLCEPGVIRSPDGTQLAMLLRENRRRRNSFVMFSNDEGRTWTEPRELPGALTGDRHVGVYAPDGRLFVSFRDTTHESVTKGDWVAWVGTYDDIVHGREGQYRIRLGDNHKDADTAYPGVERLPDGTIVVTTYGHWTPGDAPYVVSVRLTLDELDARVRPRAEGEGVVDRFTHSSAQAMSAHVQRRNSTQRSVSSALLAVGLFFGAASAAEAQAQAQAQDPYIEGPVVVVSRLRTEPGQGPAYLRYIFGDYARIMAAYKEAGIILDWGVLSVQPRTPEDPDVILTTRYANMAALDGLAERTRPIVQKVMGMNTDQAARASTERQAMRKQIGSDLMRVLVPRP